MKFNEKMIRPMVAILAFALCGAPEALAQAAQQQPAPATSQDSAQQAQPTPAPTTDSTQQTWPTQETPNAQTPAPATTPDATQDQNSAAAPTQSAPSQNNATAPSNERQRVVLGRDGQIQQPAAQQNRGLSVDPSAAPLAPSSQPATSSTDQQQPENPQPQAQVAPKPKPVQPPAPQPLGTAAAEGVKTAGNGASRPSGAAIAPNRQHRVRSMMIKLGAVAAAGIAVGAVYGLSKKTPSNPPNTTAASVPGVGR